MKNLLWRIDLARQAQPHTQDNCYRFAGYCLNVSRHTLERDGEPIKLTRAEYEMLVAFVTNPGEILSRERLLRMLSARRVENPDLRTVDVLIRRLRHKLSADLLVTQHGEGYFLAADVLIIIDRTKSPGDSERRICSRSAFFGVRTKIGGLTLSDTDCPCNCLMACSTASSPARPFDRWQP